MSIGDRDGSGGKITPRDVYNYSPPQGPKHIGDRGPGLHGNNYGNCGTQGCHSPAGAETSGSARTGMPRNLPQGKH